MQRRDFHRTFIAGSVGLSGLACSTDAENPKISLGVPKPVLSLSGQSPEERVRFLKQMGIEWVNTGMPEGSTPDDYRRTREEVEKHGLKILGIQRGGVHNIESVTLGLPGRDRKIDEYCEHLRCAGMAGLHYTTYAHMALGTWRAEPGEYREGVATRLYDESKPMGQVHGVKPQRADLDRVYTEDEIWENYEYFISRVAPVAEEYKVRIGIHPDDPPGRPLGNVPRCIFSSFNGYKRALEMAGTEYVGMCLCTGCWLSGGESMGKSVIETIKYFGERNRIFFVHFRNVSATVPKFAETFLDDGYMDMYQVMKALMETGFDGGLIGDHWPEMVGHDNVGTAYTFAYIKALINSIRSASG
jgi:mannonate dehydratase